MNVSFILIFLLFGAVATYFAGDKLAKTVALFFSLASIVGSIFILNQYNQGINSDFIANWISNPNLYIALKVDGLSLAMLLLTTVLTSIIIFSSFGNEYKNSKSFYALVLFMSFAMVGTFLSADAFLYYIFWELSLIPIYFIALIWGSGDPEARKKAVIKFFIYTLAGSLFMLVAFIYLFQKVGSLMIGDLYAIHLTNQEQFWIFLAMFLAYAIKIPIIPFHTWQANVYQKSPAVGTMLLSGIMLKMGLYSVIRWQLPIAPFAAKMYMPILIGLSIAGVVYGSIVALQQRNIKKLLAYSSLAHVGLIAAGAYTLTLDGLRGAVLQMIAHGFVVVGLFFAAEVIERRFNTQEIAEMGGIRIQDNKFASMFMIVMLASVALPGTFNFVGEFTLLYSLYSANIWFAVIAGTTIILGAVYMLKMFQHVMLGEANAKTFKSITANESIVFVVIIVVLLFFGLFSKPITDLVTPALQEILLKINKV
ncbi:NADH-quinone oxidoreductase subunit M [Flavobacterium psychrophilum]|uniref:NADH dehydrogenase I, M subunit n=1 Tax=Flavobacterium psychrophilum (strain ATCC 49511 / DSM 21280 / CIP 103535 / JIP02/86) TaxID=402612 RepID=A6H1Q1_FLAPJ|nr:NADH-quinone oxidoreductase subunit M [Flavobacterium psychrophilum]AIG30946.1 NADH-quinone oxidoreductase subunit M [Flavobacterium psychrophilum]AIG33223.1 NADH-quinone oxidoreductase subunit M [Flavobacterium psychrophilum]AIG35372.1 NADH-quinone oxidoreductase subunit M [Flavobacterium psychrophilum]AIG37732.1 NADH-quinone oxidoreductase subunit M [Flavobacterium psychrophilum]AIG40004.1 NADH-quinone oxidoreductase subunit M [Flavobacterium psychrophilum]